MASKRARSSTEANALLDRIIEKNLITARGVYGFFPANAVGDDVELYTDAHADGARTISLSPPAGEQGRQRAVPVARRLHRAERNRAARSHRRLRGDQRYRSEGALRRFRAEHDDYNAIMAEAIADRLAEAFAECLHKRVRDEWGYGCEKS